MDIVQIIMAGIIGVAGWTWGIIQFFINRRYQKRDKALEKRFEAYQSYMKKIDELTIQMRTDPNTTFNTMKSIFPDLIDDDPDKVKDGLIKLHENLLDLSKKSTHAYAIVNHELNNLLLVCSDELLSTIQEYKQLFNEYFDEIQSIFHNLTPENIKDMDLDTILRNNRSLRFKELDDEILRLMRKELGYNK